ncbi:MAG: hypothetical protein HC893_14580 [Chloroflexaceae bacterium]|nr:hypothetical protein [Chloroflexaceae bacterium]
MISINSSTGPLLQLNGVILLILILVVGAWIGWSYGFRSFLSVTLASTVGYFLFVGGGNLILDYINNIYSNLPRIFALLTGGDPFAAGTLEPIAVPFTLPLALRVLFFVVFVMVGYYYNTKPAWYSNNLKNPADPHIQLLGGFTGALTALVWVSAANVFWQEYIAETGSTSPGLIKWASRHFARCASICALLHAWTHCVSGCGHCVAHSRAV